MTESGSGIPVVRVAILGCGNVGGALYEALSGRAEEIAALSGVRFEVAGVARRDLNGAPRVAIPAALLTDDAASLVTRPDVDVVVELIGGLEPARSLITAALSAGRPVVTANKALLAVAGPELAALAAAHGVDLLYEAAAAGAVPVVRALRESLAGERITRVMGIVNGTTNFILSEMAEAGSNYETALADAQRLGLAERDPSADVEGHDAAAKAAILAGLAFGCDVAETDVYREGISHLEAVDVEFARRLGYVVKLLAIAEVVGANGEVSVRVHPAMVPAEHPLASVSGAFNAVFIEGESCGEIMLYGRGAGGRPTASAVLGDLVDAARNHQAGVAAPPPRRKPATLRPLDDLHSAFYVSMDVSDRPGVLAGVAKAFGDHGVSIRTMEQIGLGDEARLVFLTHVAREGAVRTTLEELAKMPAVDRIGGVLRVVDTSPGGPLGLAGASGLRAAGQAGGSLR